MIDLVGRHIIITGASSGIGRATALMLAGNGASVSVIARSENKLEAVVHDIEAAGGHAMAIAADAEFSGYHGC